ncbi:MAG: hypothetical protein AB7G37_04635 [Solirubrobacteraceae bacterium]
MTSTFLPLRRAALPTFLVAGMLTLTACGGDGDTTNASALSSSGGAGDDSARTALRACLKKQGVELPERPERAGERGGAPGGYGGPPPGGLPGGGLPGGGPPGRGTDGADRGSGGDDANGAGGFTGADAAGDRRRGRFGTGLSDEEREKLQKAMEACGSRMGGRSAGGQRGGRPAVRDADYRERVKAYATCVRKNGYDLPDPDFSGDGPIFDPDEVDQSDAKFRRASAACQTELRPS